MAVKVFISYSHKDEKLKNDLCEHLSTLRRQNIISEWHDRKIIPGTNWKDEIDENLSNSELILFLISSSFMNSDYCNDIEVKKALELHKEGKVCVIPIVIRAVKWNGMELSKIQALPTDAKAVTSWENEDEAWLDVINGIEKHLKEFHSKKLKNEIKTPKGNDEIENISTDWLDDIEINLTHKHVDKINLSDIYIIPDVKIGYTSDDLNDIKSAEELLKYNKCIILADEQQGKSSLLKIFYKKILADRSYYPVFINGENVKEYEINKILKKEIKRQYNLTVDEYFELLGGKAIFIDDIDKIKLNNRYQEDLFKELKNKFSCCFFTASSFYEHSLSEISALADFKTCNILGMGNKKREEMILKWISLGQEHIITDEDLYSKCDELKDKVNLIIKKNIVPTKPIYILMLLQWFETQDNLNLELSSYGHCYERLIYQSLQNANIGNRNIDKYLNILTELSWSLFNNNSSINQSELEMFFADYEKEYILSSGERDRVLDKLIKHSILKSYNDEVTFKYPYIYYFFVAKKIAESYTKNTADFDRCIQNLIDKIYKEDMANILIFITHHTRDEWILDKIRFTLSNLYSSQKPASLDKEQLSFMREFIIQIPDLVIEQREIKKERDRYNQKLDKYEMDNSERNYEHESEARDIFKNINQVFKGIEILGQIINNRYASLKKAELRNLAEDGILCGLRFLEYFIEMTDVGKNEIIRVISNHLYENPEVTNTEVEKFAENAYLLLNYGIISGFIRKIAISIGSKDAFEIYKDLKVTTKTPALILINQAIELHFNKKFNFKELKDNYEKLKGNPVCIRILRELVIQHIYLFPVSTREKQQLSELLELSIKGQELISQKQKRIGY